MRSFIAIPMTEDAAQALIRQQQRLQTGRPVPRENPHLTLAFLDDQPEEILEALHEDLLRLRFDPFTLSLSGIGQFDSSIHTAVTASPELTALQNQISRTARHAGIVLPRRRFRPHVTIARLQPNTAPILDESTTTFRYPDMLVTQFALYASILHPKGARHECLATYPYTSSV
ncbi:RNA 2',3'-cyclic phosphodiesterase [Ruegeria sp. HKCCD8929]|uniref:RNA 2',3'-cyclic phosphodiesterase n=1 Tax=Ruegeria sp. HKCCD8929 TaxID=2683006 RepID=UPI00148817D7|nr:RNA 2',3'-cyclic phosphodiesterase [Ruegeria sp. HKCCD8929]